MAEQGKAYVHIINNAWFHEMFANSSFFDASSYGWLLLVFPVSLIAKSKHSRCGTVRALFWARNLGTESTMQHRTLIVEVFAAFAPKYGHKCDPRCLSHFADQNCTGLCSYAFFCCLFKYSGGVLVGFLSVNWFAGIVFQVSKTSDFFYRFAVLILSPDSGPKMMTMQ
jgi:hypothetical protein